MRKLVALIALAAVATGWHVLWNTEARRVRRTFARAGEALRKEGPELPFAALAKGRALAALVAPGCRLEIPEREVAWTLSAEDLPRQAAAFRAQSASIRVAFEDLEVTFPDEGTAQATCDFFYDGQMEPLGFEGRDARALEATLEKDAESGGWRFRRVRLAAIVRR